LSRELAEILGVADGETLSNVDSGTTHLAARVPRDLAVESARVAAADGRTVSGEIRRLIAWRVEAERSVEPRAGGSDAASTSMRATDADAA
jgi:hypothetical protein